MVSSGYIPLSSQGNGENAEDLNWFHNANKTHIGVEFVQSQATEKQVVKSETTSVKGEIEEDAPEAEHKRRTQDDYHPVKSWESAHNHAAHPKELLKEHPRELLRELPREPPKEEKKQSSVDSSLLTAPSSTTKQLVPPLTSPKAAERVSLQKRKPDVDGSRVDRKGKSSAVSNSDSDASDGPEGELQEEEKDRLLLIMMQLFQGKDLEVDTLTELNKEQRFTLGSLVLRKFGIKVNPMCGSATVAETINSQRDNSRTKRLEENYKLVFKKALKYLLRKYKRVNTIKGKKSELEHQFYKFYFEALFKKEGIDKELDIRIDGRGNFNGHSLFNPKTINSKYVISIMKSQTFYDHFLDFLENCFVADYNRTREFKIQKVIEKCNECFASKKGTASGYEEVKNYVEKNPKCKLPWSDAELESAKESVRQLLANKLRRKDSDAGNETLNQLDTSTTA